MKRALLTVGAVTAVATVLSLTVSPISPTVAWSALTAKEVVERPNTPAPRNGRKALRLLHTDLTKLATDYSHKRYRAVCADLTKKERKALGSTSQCMLTIAILNAFAPIKKFTITSAKLSRDHTQGTVSAYVNRNKKHRINAILKWEGSRYRLDHQSGWRPKF